MNIMDPGRFQKESLSFPDKSNYIFLLVILFYAHAILYAILDKYVPVFSGKFLTIAIIAVLTVCFYIICLGFLRNKIVPGGLPIAFLCLFIVNGTLSIVNMLLYFGTVDLMQFSIGFYRSVLSTIPAIIAYLSLRTVFQAYRLLQIIAYAGLVIGIIGIITYLIGDPWIFYLLQLRNLDQYPVHFSGVLRMTSVLWNPLLFGILMALNGILAWNMLLFSKRAGTFVCLLFTISVIGTTASFTRTAWLILVVGCIISSLWGGRILIRKIIAIMTISVVIAWSVVYLPLPKGHYANMAEGIHGHIEATFIHENPRVKDFEVNMKRIFRFPIGHGLGTAGYAALPTRELVSPAIFNNYIAADNNYLSMILQMGIQGVLLFIIAQVFALKRIIRKWKIAKGELRIILGTAISWTIGMMIGAVFLNLWEYNLLPHIVFAVLGAGLKVSDALEGEKRCAGLEWH